MGVKTEKKTSAGVKKTASKSGSKKDSVKTASSKTTKTATAKKAGTSTKTTAKKRRPKVAPTVYHIIHAVLVVISNSLTFICKQRFD